MKNIRIEGTYLLLEEYITFSRPAVCAERKSRRSGKLRMEIIPHSTPESAAYSAGKYGGTVGAENVAGRCDIRVDLEEVLSICRRAARNASHVANQGPVNVKFIGTRHFEAAPVAAGATPTIAAAEGSL